MNFYGYSIRLTKDGDAALVQAMLQPKLPALEKLFGKLDIAKLCELSLYSLVAFSEDNELVGFAAFDDNPMATLPPEFPRDSSDKAGRWAVQAALDLGYRREMLMWVALCANVADADEEDTVHKALLSSLLVLSTDTMAILETSAFEFGCIPTFLKPIAFYQKEDFVLSVCACRRSFFFPRLTMRRAREEDQDDLTPVIDHAQQRGLPLTQIPESACPSKPYAVARLIAAQTKQNAVFVAEVRKQIMGVIALTSDVHLPSLHENYDLDCFEGLMSKTIERRLTVIAKKQVDKFFVDPLAAAGTETVEEETAKPLVEYLTRWPENVFRITMLCMEVEYESRAIDVINFAFSKLNKEFCLMTLPYVSSYHPLLRHFYRVPARSNASNADLELSADSRCLYLLHVDAMSSGFAVRSIRPEDMDSLSELLDNFPDRGRLLEAASLPPEGRLNLVAVLSDQIVGFAVLDNFAPVADIASHFDLESLVNLEHHLLHCHASLVLYVLNPVYRYRSRLFFQEIMRQTGKSIIYCPVFPPPMELPDVLEDLILVSGRQHAHLTPPCYWTTQPPEEEEDGVNSATPPEDSNETTKSPGDGPSEDVAASAGVEPGLNVPSNAVRPLVNNGLEKDIDVQLSSESGGDEFATKDISTMDQSTSERDGSFSKENGFSTNDQQEAEPGAGEEKADKSQEQEELKQETPDNDDQAIQTGSADEGETAGNDGVSEEPSTEAKEEYSDQLNSNATVGVPTHELELNAQSTLKSSSTDQRMPETTVAEGSKSNAEESQDIPTSGHPSHDITGGDLAKKPDLISKEQKENMVVAGQEGIIPAAGQTDQSDVALEDQEGSTTSEEVTPDIESESLKRAHPRIRRGYFYGFNCALYVLARQHLYRYKTVINARIVVVGSSITTAAFLHRLLASHEFHFTNLIMISDVGFQRLSSLTALSSLIADLGPKHSFSKLGLDCQIKIIRAKVERINRKDRTVRLTTGKNVPYDWLVLSSGLQDQTRQNLKFRHRRGVKGIVRADELVMNASEIAKQIKPADRLRSIPPVVVYGATLEAFGAVQALLNLGLEGKNIVLIHPDKMNIEAAAMKYMGDPDTSQMLLATLIQCGISIYSGLKLIRVEKNSNTSWISSVQFEDLIEEQNLDGMSLVYSSLEKRATQVLQPLVAIEGILEAPKCSIHRIPMGDKEAIKEILDAEKPDRPERKLIFPCSLLVTCDKRQVDPRLFRAIHKEMLIFDGRIVVDGYFQTNDPRIFAAGNQCKFSRHCGDNLPKLEAFCPWELGNALAPAFKAVVATSIYGTKTRCASEEDIQILKPHKWPRPNLPSLKTARCIGGYLPGEQWFLSATAPKFCTPVAGPPAMSLYTRTASAYCRLDIMDNKEVGRIIYFGKERLVEWKITSFVGLPETLLNGLVQRYESNQVKDIAKFLLQPWAALLFHDKFLAFFQSLSEGVKDVTRKSRRSMTVFVAELATGSIRSLEPKLAKESHDMIYNKFLSYLQTYKLDLLTYNIPWQKKE